MLRARLHHVKGTNMSWEAHERGMLRAQINVSIASVVYRVESCATMQCAVLQVGVDGP